MRICLYGSGLRLGTSGQCWSQAGAFGWCARAPGVRAINKSEHENGRRIQNQEEAAGGSVLPPPARPASVDGFRGFGGTGLLLECLPLGDAHGRLLAPV